MDVQLKTFLADNPVFRCYLFYTAILTLKMMFMSLLTIRQRVMNNSFVSEEDAMYLKGMVSRTNEQVERVRRGHRNDMENIYLFFIIGFAYIWTDPSPFWANLLFLVFTVTRIVHTCRPYVTPAGMCNTYNARTPPETDNYLPSGAPAWLYNP